MRYVIANRRAGKFSFAEKLASRGAMNFAMNSLAAGVVNANDPSDALARRVAVVDTEPGKLQAMNFGPDVIVEPEIRYWPQVMPPLDLSSAPPRPFQAAAALGNGVAIVCTGAGQPLPNAAVKLYARNLGGATELAGVSDATGTCNISCLQQCRDASWEPTSSAPEEARGRKA